MPKKFSSVRYRGVAPMWEIDVGTPKLYPTVVTHGLRNSTPAGGGHSTSEQPIISRSHTKTTQFAVTVYCAVYPEDADWSLSILVHTLANTNLNRAVCNSN